MKLKMISNQTKKYATLLLAMVALVGCKKVDASKGNAEDHIVNESSFTAIDFAVGGEFNFTNSNTTSIVVNTSQRVFDAMDIYVENSTLHFKEKKGYNIKNSEEIEITVMAPNVTSLANSASGNLEANINNAEGYSNFDLILSGSGSINANSIIALEQSFTISGSGSITVDEVIAEVCETTISGAGGVKIKGGIAAKSNLIISGSGKYQAFDLDSDKVDITVSGSGISEVTALSELDVVISGSGDVYYKGFPVINYSGSGSGSLINGN